MAEGYKKDHKKVLDAALENLTENLNPDDVLISLVTLGAIENKHKQLILSLPTDEQQVAKLVELLRTRELKHYETFMNVLKEKRVDIWRDVKSKEAPVLTTVPRGTASDGPGPTAGPASDALSKEVSQADLAVVSKQIGSWDEVNLILFYDDLNISDDDIRIAAIGETNPVVRVLHVLKKWRSVQTSNATRGKILDALGDHNDIIRSLKARWNIQ